MSYQELEQSLADAGVYGHFTGGGFAEPHGNTVIESINPANGRVLARFAEATEAQVDAAVSAVCVFTEGADQGLRVVKSIDAGTVCVNYGVKAAVESPSGGYKQSGVGKERGIEAIFDDTQLKSGRVFHG